LKGTRLSASKLTRRHTPKVTSAFEGFDVSLSWPLVHFIMLFTIVLGTLALLALVVVVACYVASDKVAPVKVNGAKIIVTGGSEGLGLCLCQQLVQQGANIVVIARNQAKLDQALVVLRKVSIDPGRQRRCLKHFFH